MHRERLNHLVEILSTTLLGLSQNPDFSIEILDLLVFLFTICSEVGFINIEDLDSNDFGGRRLPSVETTSAGKRKSSTETPRQLYSTSQAVLLKSCASSSKHARSGTREHLTPYKLYRSCLCQ